MQKRFFFLLSAVLVAAGCATVDTSHGSFAVSPGCDTVDRGHTFCAMKSRPWGQRL